MPLLLHGLTPLHWTAAGAGIAAITITLAWVLNTRLGISSAFDDLCGTLIRAPYFRRASLVSSRAWRMPFVIGLVAGGALSSILGGGWEPTWNLGMLDARLGLDPLGKVAWMFGGGLLIGAGTRMAGGCTSGHGIFGLANFEWPSLLATMSFMAGGVATTQLLYRVLLP